MRAGILLFMVGTWFIFGCSVAPPAPEVPVGAPAPHIEAGLIEFARKGDFLSALEMADQLRASSDSHDREIGHYWKLLLWVNDGSLDSAVAMLDTLTVTWSGKVRKLHADALSQALVAWKESRRSESEVGKSPSGVHQNKALKSKLMALEQRNLHLEAEVERLDGLRHRYESLMKELETIH